MTILEALLELKDEELIEEIDLDDIIEHVTEVLIQRFEDEGYLEDYNTIGIEYPDLEIDSYDGRTYYTDYYYYHDLDDILDDFLEFKKIEDTDLTYDYADNLDSKEIEKFVDFLADKYEEKVIEKILDDSDLMYELEQDYEDRLAGEAADAAYDAWREERYGW